MYSVHMHVETNSLDQEQKSKSTGKSKHILYGPKDINPACIKGREVTNCTCNTCCIFLFVRVSVSSSRVL